VLDTLVAHGKVECAHAAALRRSAALTSRLKLDGGG